MKFMKFTKIRDVKSPARGTEQSAGLDFFIPNDWGNIVLLPGESTNIPSGIKLILDPGYTGLFLNKSGVGVKGVLVGAQVVDSDYRGELHLNVHNTSNKEVTFKGGQKLMQLLIFPVLLATPMEINDSDYAKESNTERGEGGYGSTGAF